MQFNLKECLERLTGGSHPPNKGPQPALLRNLLHRRKLVTNPPSITHQISNIESAQKVLHYRLCLELEESSHAWHLGKIVLVEHKASLIVKTY